MEVSELTLKLILVLVPGAIAGMIYEKLTLHAKWSPFKFIIHSIMFGGVSYLLVQGLQDLLCGTHSLRAFWKNLPSKEIPYQAVIYASLASIPLGLAASAIDQYKLINRFGKFLRITNKYGDENLYYYFLNAQHVSEVYIRDRTAQLTYHGLIESFSESKETHEIVLRDVVVYDYDTSQELYTLDKIYLSKHKNEIVIELPYLTSENESNG